MIRCAQKRFSQSHESFAFGSGQPEGLEHGLVMGKPAFCSGGLGPICRLLCDTMYVERQATGLREHLHLHHMLSAVARWQLTRRSVRAGCLKLSRLDRSQARNTMATFGLGIMARIAEQTFSLLSHMAAKHSERTRDPSGSTENPVGIDALDRIDRRILRLLQEDGRMSVSQIARQVHLSVTPCLTRVRRLEAAGFIRGYFAQLDPERVGLGLQAYVTVNLDRTNPDVFERFSQAMHRFEEVIECQMVGGGFDYLVKVRVRDMRMFRKFLGQCMTAESRRTSDPHVLRHGGDQVHAPAERTSVRRSPTRITRAVLAVDFQFPPSRTHLVGRAASKYVVRCLSGLCAP